VSLVLETKKEMSQPSVDVHNTEVRLKLTDDIVQQLLQMRVSGIDKDAKLRTDFGVIKAGEFCLMYLRQRKEQRRAKRE